MASECPQDIFITFLCHGGIHPVACYSFFSAPSSFPLYFLPLSPALSFPPALLTALLLSLMAPVNLMSALPARLITARQTDLSAGERERRKEIRTGTEKQKRKTGRKRNKLKINVSIIKKNNWLNWCVSICTSCNPLPLTGEAITISQVEIKIHMVCMCVWVCLCVYSMR